MLMFDTAEEAAAQADRNATEYAGAWVVHSIANEARTRLRYVAVNELAGWHLPVLYRTDTGIKSVLT